MIVGLAKRRLISNWQAGLMAEAEKRSQPLEKYFFATLAIDGVCAGWRATNLAAGGPWVDEIAGRDQFEAPGVREGSA